MRIGLFIGTESFTWKASDFTAASRRAKTYGIDTLFIKIADGTDLWYGGYDGINAMLIAVTAQGVAVAPYLFSYGSSLGGYIGEVAIVNTLIADGYTVCLDMESAWNGNTRDAANLVRDLAAPIYISTWADPNEQQWGGLLPVLAPKCRAFLPQVYTPYLATTWLREYTALGIPAAQVVPTFNASSIALSQALSSYVLWEYGALSDALLAQYPGKGIPPMSLSPSGEVATFPSPVSQFQPGKSAYECVAFSVALVHYAGPPQGSPAGTPAEVIVTAEAWYQSEEGSNSAANTSGMSLDAEYAMLKGLGMGYQPLPVSATTQHDSDMAHVASAVQKGMPVLICGAENGFYDVGLGDIVPYSWTPTGNHCVVATGIAPSGNFLVRDMANVGHGISPGSVREYDNRHLDLVSATAIEVPFLTAPHLLQPTPDDLHVWNLVGDMLRISTPTFPELPCDPTHAIPQSWLVGRWKHNANFGPALEPERDMTAVYKTPYTVMEQEFVRGRASWHSDTGNVTWYGAAGVIMVL